MKYKAHFINIRYFAFGFLVFSGCAVLSQDSFQLSSRTGVETVRAFIEDGQLYQAKKTAQELLEENPQNVEVQSLMAEILDLEIARHKEMFDEQVPEDWTEEDRISQAKTWLERSRTYLHVRQYEQARQAAENVFLYDSDSFEASRLIDEINQAILKDAGKGSILHRSAAQDEVGQRVESYRKQAEQKLAEGRFGEARLVTSKLLLLSPNDPVGLKLQKELRVE